MEGFPCAAQDFAAADCRLREVGGSPWTAVTLPAYAARVTGPPRPFVLHADAQCVVIDKPPGLPAVPGRTAALQDCALRRVQALYADALVVHRLDMATSGLLVFARGAQAQRRLSDAFARREVAKHYVAVVDGAVDGEVGEIDLPLATDWPNRPRQQVDRVHGRPALTRWRVLTRSPAGSSGVTARTRLELQPVTGRTHQLRVHLAAVGHPILGDTLYAPAPLQAASGRLLLHAAALEFAHPATGAAQRFEAEAPF